MKRGLIAWDKTELPPEAFESRLASARKRLAERGLPALVVYSDLWRSNYARFYSNFMPYFNRGLLVIPLDDKPVLLCGLSPRVYPWIKSVTILGEILPSPNLAQKLLEICSQRGWRKIGVVDPAGLPYDLYTAIASGVGMESVAHEGDAWARSMHRRAAEIAHTAVAPAILSPVGPGLKDHEFVGRLERDLRRAGAEDLVILVTNGDAAPAPAKGQALNPGFSVSLALEYRGHWVKLARPHGGGIAPDGDERWELLSGALPYQPVQAPRPGSVVARISEQKDNGRRLFHGDTFWYGSNGLEPL